MDREGFNSGIPRFTNDIQYRGGCGSAGGPRCGMWNSGGQTRLGMGGRRKECNFILRQWQDSGEGSRVGPGYTVSDGGNVSEDGSEDEYREVKDYSMHARVHMGEVGGTCVQYTGDGRRSNIWIAEEVGGKLRRVRRDSGTIISQAAHGEPTQIMRPPDEGG